MHVMLYIMLYSTSQAGLTSARLNIPGRAEWLAPLWHSGARHITVNAAAGFWHCLQTGRRRRRRCK